MCLPWRRTPPRSFFLTPQASKIRATATLALPQHSKPTSLCDQTHGSKVPMHKLGVMRYVNNLTDLKSHSFLVHDSICIVQFLYAFFFSFLLLSPLLGGLFPVSRLLDHPTRSSFAASFNLSCVSPPNLVSKEAIVLRVVFFDFSSTPNNFLFHPRPPTGQFQIDWNLSFLFKNFHNPASPMMIVIIHCPLPSKFSPTSMHQFFFLVVSCLCLWLISLSVDFHHWSVLIWSPILGISAFSNLRPILARSLRLPPLFNLLLMILHGSVQFTLYKVFPPQLPREAVSKKKRFLLSFLPASRILSHRSLPYSS